jgi:catechol 1,2-dioxygenase
MVAHLETFAMSLDRRRFVGAASIGLSLGATSLILPAHVAATEASGDLGAQSPPLLVVDKPQTPEKFAPTEDNILGPYHRRGAPYRAKITPPLEPGEPLVVHGHVWGQDTRKPLAGAVLEVWQANAAGRYDNDDPSAPPKPGVFVNRARLVCDENGYYEFETIKPGRYKVGPELWRPAHIHYMIAAPGYKTLVTQLYFKGDPYNESDDFIKPSLIIDPTVVKVREAQVQLGRFDIVLRKA